VSLCLAALRAGIRAPGGAGLKLLGLPRRHFGKFRPRVPSGDSARGKPLNFLARVVTLA
jgi:hypothetical protein